ncbi:MAG: T9SS type A sorting domain-containing protein, partial [Bacteroidetes bacterium]|nr:T9SS type A sorting domain-containing protein [Bacteroidota bacterium]
KMKKIIFAGWIFWAWFSAAAIAQSVEGTPDFQGISFNKTSNGSIDSLLEITACGLGYTHADVVLGKRMFPVIGAFPGVDQPASVSLSGIPTGATIEKAFLYYDVSGPGTATSVQFGKYQSTIQTYTAAMIGAGPDKAWGYEGTYTFRADVTAAVTGNGTYSISGLPVDTVPGNTEDTDGATLFVFYSDPAADFIGTLHLYDGSVVIIGSTFTQTIRNVYPSDTTQAEAFMLIADMQGMGTKLKFNNGAYENTQENFWDFKMTSSDVIPGQKNSSFGVNASTDAVNLIISGLYYRQPSGLVEPVLHLESDTIYCDAIGDTYQWYFNGSLITGETSSFLIAENDGNYSVVVSIDEGCIKSSEYISYINGISNSDKPTNAGIFPNPGNGTFILRTGTNETSVIDVLNLSGQIVYSFTTSQEVESVVLESIPSGMYFVRVSGSVSWTEKLIIR